MSTPAPSLSKNLISQYIELVNNYLNEIPIKTDVDFEIVKEALRTLTEPHHQSHTIAENLKGHIRAIRDLIDDPSMFVQSPAHYNDFKNIVISQVATRIQKLEAFKSKDKEQYISEQKEFKEIKAEQHTIMKSRTAPKPSSEAHRISLEQLLQETYGREDELAREQFQRMRVLQHELPVITDEDLRDHSVAISTETYRAIQDFLTPQRAQSTTIFCPSPRNRELYALYRLIIRILPNDLEEHPHINELIELYELSRPLNRGVFYLDEESYEETKRLCISVNSRLEGLIQRPFNLFPAYFPSVPANNRVSQRQEFSPFIHEEQDLFNDRQELDFHTPPPPLQLSDLATSPEFQYDPICNAFFIQIFNIIPVDRTIALSADEIDQLEQLVIDFFPRFLNADIPAVNIMEVIISIKKRIFSLSLSHSSDEDEVPNEMELVD